MPSDEVTKNLVSFVENMKTFTTVVLATNIVFNIFLSAGL